MMSKLWVLLTRGINLKYENSFIPEHCKLLLQFQRYVADEVSPKMGHFEEQYERRIFVCAWRFLLVSTIYELPRIIPDICPKQKSIIEINKKNTFIKYLKKCYVSFIRYLHLICFTYWHWEFQEAISYFFSKMTRTKRTQTDSLPFQPKYGQTANDKHRAGFQSMFQILWLRR